VRVNAEVHRTNPFIIDDGSGKAHVKSSCAFKEFDKVRVIGYVSFNENENLLEIEPIAVHGMNEFDFDLYRKMQLVKKRLNDSYRNGK
jgi:hypothetical protein